MTSYRCDNDDIRSTFTLQVYGTQTTFGIQDYHNYPQDLEVGDQQHYTIPVGIHYTGEMLYLTYIMDHDVYPATGESLFRDVAVYENEAP